MGVANSSLVNPVRNNSSAVRLEPDLVQSLCELARASREKTQAPVEISGLLFGSFEDGVLSIEALKTFKDSGPRSDLARRERMEKAYEAAMAQANQDTALADMKAVGWFSLRGSGGLINADIEFHNRHFKQDDEVALILWREGDTQITAEFYSRAEASKFTTEDYRWSSVRLSTELRTVSSPIELSMRLRLNEDSYLRTYASNDKNERKEEWKRIATSVKRTLRSMLPASNGPKTFTTRSLNLDQNDRPKVSPLNTPAPRPIFRETMDRPQQPVERPPAFGVIPPLAPPPIPAPAPVSAGPMERERPPIYRPIVPEVSGLPMVINTKSRNKQVPWLSMALVFIMFSGITFAFLALKGIGTGSGKLSQVMRVLFPSSDLELRAEGRGDRLLLTWNRKNPAVASASTAVLSIYDGTQRFEKRLDPSQVADGSVLYKPQSGDVTFRLQVVGADQELVAGSLRVLDATNSATNNPPQILDLSNPAPANPPKVNTPVTNQAAAASPVNANPAPALPAPATNTPRTVENPTRQQQQVSRTERPQTRQTNPPSATATVQSQQVETPRPTATQPQQTSVAAPTNTSPVQNTPATPAAPKPSGNGPANQQPAASGTAINGWDPNISETLRPASLQSSQPPPASALPDGRSIFRGPKVLLQVMPNTRSLKPGMITQVTRVEVDLRVDEKGRVKAAHLTKDDPRSALGVLALSAARQWTFEPATQGGEAVESEHTVVFEFRPENQ